MASVRRRVFYEGTVQGVGFRYTACDLARPYVLAGFVRNLADGRVELVVEGDEPEVAGFLRALAGRMGGHIRSAEVLDEPPRGGPPGFGVRR